MEVVIDNRILAWMFLGMFILSGCSTITKSTLLGAGVGAAAGTGGTALSNKDKGKSVAVSALVMGVVGGVAGYFSHQRLEKRDAEVRKETLFNLEKFGVSGLKNESNFTSESKSSERILIFTDDLELFRKYKKNN